MTHSAAAGEDKEGRVVSSGAGTGAARGGQGRPHWAQGVPIMAPTPATGLPAYSGVPATRHQGTVEIV